MAEVAIIIPSYNSVPWLAATVRSALAQITPAAEIVIIDDGSTDETPVVLEKLAPGVRWERQENAGVSAARNHGARLTRSEWLLFLDSDDQLFPNALPALLESALAASAGVAYGRVLLRGKTPSETRLHGEPDVDGAPPHPARANYTRSGITTPGAAVIRRDVFEKAGGFVSGYEPMEDRDLWIKSGFLTRFAFCDTVVLDKGFHEGSAGSQDARRILSGMRSRFDLAGWCAAHRLDAAPLGATPRTIIDSAIKEALWLRQWAIIPEICGEADRRGVRTFWMRRAAIEARVRAVFRTKS